MQITREQSKKITELIRLSDGESAKLSQYGDEADVHVAVKHKTVGADNNTKRVTLNAAGTVTATKAYKARPSYWTEVTA